MGQMSVSEVAEQDVGQMSVDEGTPVEIAMTTLHVRMSEDLGRFWREVEALHGTLAMPGSFVAFLVRAVMKAWAGVRPERVAYDDVYLRDLWRCSCPVCHCRNVTPHHLRFRSRGGGEDRENLSSLCARCHLELVHGQKLAVARVDGELEWQAPGWRVKGRRRAAQA